MTLLDHAATQGAFESLREQRLLEKTVASGVPAMPEQRRPGGLSVRFLTVAQVAEELVTSAAQIAALVRHGDLPAVKLGTTPSQWRIERSKLEEFIARAYDDPGAGQPNVDNQVLSPTDAALV